MRLMNTIYGTGRKANIFHNDSCYVVELYIDDRLFRKMNVTTTLVDAQHMVEVFMNQGNNQTLLSEYV